MTRPAKKDPTPEEIAARAAAIRDSWDAATEERRRVQKEHTWQVPRAGSEVSEPQGDAE